MSATITDLLGEALEGDPQAEERLFLEIHRQLRAVAAKQVAANGRAELQPTELVNEFYMRLKTQQNLAFPNRRAFFGYVAVAMRNGF